MRSIFGFQAGTPITQKNVKQRLHKRSKRLHPDKTTQRPARVKRLAKKIYYALNYLHDSMIQDSWAANDRTVDDPPHDRRIPNTPHTTRKHSPRRPRRPQNRLLSRISPQVTQTKTRSMAATTTTTKTPTTITSTTSTARRQATPQPFARTALSTTRSRASTHSP